MLWIPSFAVRRSWHQVVFVAMIALFWSGSASANNQNLGGGNTGGGNTTGGGNATGGAAGNGTTIGQGALGEGFEVQRTGVVGESGAAPVGANAASAAGQQGAAAGGRTGGGLGGFGGGGGGLGAAFGNLFGNANSQSSSSSTPPIRTRLRAAVDLPASVGLTPENTSVIATNRLRQSSLLQPARRNDINAGQRFNGVNVQVDGRTAILTGQVRTESDRRMSHLMMRLEPGISQVQNRIELSPRP